MLHCLDLEDDEEFKDESAFKGNDGWVTSLVRRSGNKLLRMTGDQSEPEPGAIDEVLGIIGRILNVPEIDLHHLFSADKTKFLLYSVTSRSLVG